MALSERTAQLAPTSDAGGEPTATPHPRNRMVIPTDGTVCANTENGGMCGLTAYRPGAATAPHRTPVAPPAAGS